MPGRRSKQKGNRRERQAVELLKGLGLEAKRVPLSGAAAGFKGDIATEFPGVGDCRMECKARANAEGFKTVVKWLGDNAGLLLIADRSDPLVVLNWETFSLMVQEALQARPGASANDEDGE